MIELHGSGYPRLFVDGAEQPLKLRRGWAALVFLAERGGKVAREHLAGLLWPDASPAIGRGRLRRLVHEVNAALGSDLVDGDADALWLAEPGLASDLAATRRRAQAIVGAAETPAAAEVRPLLAADAARYLDGFTLDAEPFMEWVEQQRADQERLVMRALQRIAEQAARRGDAELALGAAERLLAFDPCIEAAHGARLVALGRRGDAGALEAAYFACAKTLRDELGIRPSARLESDYALARELLAEPGAAGKPPEPGAPEIRFAESGDGCVAYASVGSGGETVLVVPDLFSHLEVAFEDPRLRRCIGVGSSRVDLQACKLEYSIVSPK